MKNTNFFFFIFLRGFIFIVHAPEIGQFANSCSTIGQQMAPLCNLHNPTVSLSVHVKTEKLVDCVRGDEDLRRSSSFACAMFANVSRRPPPPEAPGLLASVDVPDEKLRVSSWFSSTICIEKFSKGRKEVFAFREKTIPKKALLPSALGV